MKAAAGLALALLLIASAAGAAEAGEAPYEFVLAKMLAAEGAWQEATEKMARAIELAPDDPYLRVDYATLLLQIGRRGEAVAQADTAKRLAPSDPDVLSIYARAQLASADGDPEAVARARQAYEELRELRPGDLQSLTALGRLYLGAGQGGQAAEVFREALTYRPDNSWLLSLLADSLLRAGRTDEAEGVLANLLRVEPDEARARLTLAELQQKRGARAAAAETLGSAPPEVMEDVDYRRRLAFALYRSGDLEESLSVVQSLLAEDEEDFGGLYLVGLIYAAEGHHERASAVLQKLHARRPDSLELALLTARVLERQSATDEAVALLERLAARLREDGSEEEARLAEYQRLTVLSRAEQWDRVLRGTEPLLAGAAAELSLDLVFLHYQALTRLGRGEQALADLAALESPLLSPAQRAAKEAELLFELDREQEALARLDRLQGMSDPDAPLLAAQVFHAQERYAEVIPILERLEPESSDSVQLLFWLAAAYERTGRHAEAEHSFRRLLEIDDSFAPALNYLGYMWAELGRNLDEALDLVQRAVSLEPDNGAYVDSLGWALFRLGRFEEAEPLLERAARLVPADAVIFEHLGDLYLAVGRRAEARRLYERALSLDGENAEAVSGKLARLRHGL